jgi:hypothetical protein
MTGGARRRCRWRERGARALRAAGLAVLAILLGQCAPVRRPGAPPAALGSALHPVLAPDPALQRLIDPRPADGPAWLGADVASAVEVGGDRWIWIFGDTLLGRVDDDCPPGEPYCRRAVDERPDGAMIANSVGVMTRRPDGSPSPIVKFWRTVDGRPAPIFAAERPEEILWPLALAAVDDVLLVAASRHTRATGLTSLGSVLIRVENPAAPPDRWRYTRYALPNAVTAPDAGEPLTWSTALVREGDLVYLFGEHGTGWRARSVLARFGVDHVHDPDWKPALEYLLRAEGAGAASALRSAAVWSAALDPVRLYDLEGLPGTSEAALVFDDTLGWYTYGIPWLTLDVHLYRATRLAGPWRDEGVVYRVPVPPRDALAACRRDAPGGEARDGGSDGSEYAAYAAKPHPELAAAGGYALSYNLNAHGGTLRDSVCAVEHVPGVYVPQLVSGHAARR